MKSERILNEVHPNEDLFRDEALKILRAARLEVLEARQAVRDLGVIPDYLGRPILFMETGLKAEVEWIGYKIKEVQSLSDGVEVDLD